jgi:hypothetical protein
MKKILFLFTSLSISVVLYSQQSTNYFIFQGVGSTLGPIHDVLDNPMGMEQPPSYGALYVLANKLSTTQQQYVKNNQPDPLTTPGSNNVIIGHSQGGLRALAWAGFCAQSNGKYPVPNTVITVSGINNGFVALIQGIGNLENEISEDIVTIVNGINYTYNIGATNNLNSAQKAALQQLMTNNPISSLINSPSIPDMEPWSTFIQDYICGPTKPFNAPPPFHLDTISRGGLPGLVVTTTNNLYPQIPSKVKIGQIVGTDNSFLDIASQCIPSQQVPTDPLSLRQLVFVARGAANISGIGWACAELYYSQLANVAWWYAWINSSDYNNDIAQENYCANASTIEENFSNFLTNIDSEWAQLIGSPQSDGFIPTCDTGIPLSLIGGQSINPAVPNGIYVLPPYDTNYTIAGGIIGAYNPPINHITEGRDNEIWGPLPGPINTAAFNGGSIETGGIIQQMLGLSQQTKITIVQ